jgi:ankyrin repeat protein
MKEVVVPPDPSRVLPEHPDLEQQKKQARELQRDVDAGAPDALRRVRARHPRGAATDTPFALHDAQLVIAREYGFASWPALKREIERRRAQRQAPVFVTDLAYYEERAAGLVSAHAAGVPQALAQIRQWHPGFARAADADIRRAAFDLDGARLVYARQHGCEDWPALAAHLRAVATGTRFEPFREAFEALQSQQWDRLTAVIQGHPDVLRARGTNGNTLLNLATSLAGRLCEGLPASALRLFDLLVAGGADVNAANDRGWTPLHQAAYSNQVPIAERLIAAGAAVDCEAHGEGGTPLAVALFWGHREVADVLATVAAVPDNLRIAAALGRRDLIDAAFAPDGSLTEAARRGRGFYRPHSGFPLWHPSNDRQEILDEALVWAAKADRVDVLPLLVARGADVNGDPYRGTPLIWAASMPRLAAARWLLDHGADVNRRATFGGPEHGEGVTALHLAAQSDHVEMARLLVERGADPSIPDAIYGSTPAGWADHFGASGVRALLAR